MHGKRKTCLMILLSCLISCLPGIHVSARDEIPDGMPAVIRWEDGSGYSSDGNRISGGWAYDTVNEAGRFVLFDENGTVLKKAEDWENRDDTEEYFTPTEQETGTIALRSEPFDRFEGKITVTVESGSGISRKYVLSSENLYELNVSVNSGTYRIQKAEAEDSRYVYATDYAKEQFQMEEKGLLLFHIKVTEQQIGEVQPEDRTKMTDNQAEEKPNEKDNRKLSGEKSASGINSANKVSVDSRYMNLKHLFIGAGLVVILAAGLLIRSRKNKYN